MTRDAKQIPIGPLLKGRVIVLKGKQKKEDVLNTLVDLLAQEEGMVPRDDLAWVRPCVYVVSNTSLVSLEFRHISI